MNITLTKIVLKRNEANNDHNDTSDANVNENNGLEKIDQGYRDDANNKAYIGYDKISDEKDDIYNDFANITYDA